MNALAPAGWLWLLTHEIRLGWRNIGGKRLWFILLGGGFVWLAAHLAAWGLLHTVESIDATAPSPSVLALIGGMLWFFISILISQATAHSVSALFDRGDLDLLLSSPLPPRAIFVVRGLGIALSAGLLPAVLLLPLAHVGLLLGLPRLLAIYPVVAALGLGCAAAGMMLTMTLVRLLGARRAKTAAQVLAALIGAGFFLLIQAQNMMPVATRKALLARLQQETQTGGWLTPESPLWWPARALMGDPLPLLGVLAIGVGGFWLVVNLTYRRFVTGSQESVTGGRTRIARPGRPATFRSGLPVLMMTKEWKLLRRDPQVISQTLLQGLYMLPMVFLGFRGGGSAWLLVPGLVMITSMLAGNLAWLTIAAEDAPELIGSAPVPIDRVRWIKAAAAVLPVLVLLLPLALWWLLRDPYQSLVLLVACSGGMLSAALCQIWNPRQGNRRDMKARYRQNRLVNFLETLGAMGWAGVAFCMNGHWLWMPLPLFFVTLGPGAAWLLGHDARRHGVLA